MNNCYIFATLLTLAGGIQQVSGQTRELIIDFKTKDVDSASVKEIDKLEKGDFYKIKVKNVNTLLYKVQVTTDDVEDTTTVTLPTFESFALTSLSGLLDKLPGLNIGNIQGIGTPSSSEGFFLMDDISLSDSYTVDELEKKYSDMSDERTKMKDAGERIKSENELLTLYLTKTIVFLKNTNDLIGLVNGHDYALTSTFDLDNFLESKPAIAALCEFKLLISESYASYVTDMSKFSGALRHDKNSVPHNINLDVYTDILIPTIDQVISKIDDDGVQKLIRMIAAKRIEYEQNRLFSPHWISRFDRIKSRVASGQLQVDTVIALLSYEKPQKTIRDFNATKLRDTIYTIRKQVVDSVAAVKSSAMSSQLSYKSEINKLSSASKLSAEVVFADSLIHTYYDTLFVLLRRYESQYDPKNVSKMLSTIAMISNHKDYSYVSLPNQMNGDQVKLRIFITPRDTANLLHSYQIQKILLPRSKGTFLGTGSSFYLSGLYNESYTLNSIDTTFERIMMDSTITINDTIYSPIKEDVTKLEAGISINVSFNIRVSQRFSVGVSVGPGVTISKPVRPRLLFGLNASYGSRNRFTIGIGGIAGYADRKSTAIQEGGSYQILPSEIVVSKFTSSFYLSFGFIRSF